MLTVTWSTATRLDEESVVRAGAADVRRHGRQLPREPEDAGRGTSPLSGPAESVAREWRTRPAPIAPGQRGAQDVAQHARDADAPELSGQDVERIDTLTDKLHDQEESQNHTCDLAEESDLRQVQAELKAKHLIEELEHYRDAVGAEHAFLLE